MSSPRILTFNFHEPYLCLMARAGLPLEIGLYREGPLARTWLTRYRPVPPNLTFLEEERWREDLAAGRFDVVIAQNESNAATICKTVLLSRTPLLLVCHNRRRFLETTIEDEVDQREMFGKVLERLQAFAEFVFISESKRDDYGVPGRVIPPGIDVEEYGGYTGEAAEVIRVGNNMVSRNLMFDVDFQEQVCEGFPHRVVGDDPLLPKARAADSFEELLGLYRSRRCLLHVTREEWEDGYNLAMLEAMACGMPVVSLANRTSPLTDGVDGYVAADPGTLRARIAELLGDVGLARAIGARGRETAAREFPITRFVERWREAIFAAAERSPRGAWSARNATQAARTGKKSESPKARVLLHYMASPVTTGRYIERALRKRHEVVTAGFRCPETILKRWGFEGEPAPYPPHQVDTPLNCTYAELLERLPEGFSPHLYLWVDSGPKQVAPDIERLGVPKLCYLIDTHLAPDLRIGIARHFNFTFLAQAGQVELFQRAGVPNVAWLPLACCPELHNIEEGPREYDVAYVGRVQDDESDRRRMLLETIGARFPNSRIAQCWPEEMARVYARARIVVNAAVNRDVNMRVFEATASGALLITDEADGLDELFEEGVHYVKYRDDAELPELIGRYLKDDAARERIARAGREHVLKHHTYERRMEQMLEAVLEAAGAHGGISGESRYHCGGYYCSARPELAAHVPADARRILDVGCGGGEFGKFLKRRGAEEVVGIEVMDRPAQMARRALDKVLHGDIESMQLPFDDRYFDCIVCGDVLEHLRDPGAALRKLARVLSPKGYIVISIPNVRFCQVVQMLAEGRWKYEDAGILDRTHLRFFTAVEMRDMVEGAGFEIETMTPLSMLGPEQLPRNADGGFTLGRLTIGPLSDVEIRDFLTYQYLILAKPCAASRLERAQEAMERGDLETAHALAQRAVDEDATERLFLMGKAQGRLGKLDTAEELLRGALALAPGRADIAGQLGTLLVAQNRPDDAAPYLEQAVAANPEDARALGALGLAALARGLETEAFERLKASFAASFDSEALLRHFAALGERLGRLDEVEPALRAFADFYPGNLPMVCRHAEALRALGRLSEARERLEQILMFAPNNADARGLLETIDGMET